MHFSVPVQEVITTICCSRSVDWRHLPKHTRERHWSQGKGASSLQEPEESKQQRDSGQKPDSQRPKNAALHRQCVLQSGLLALISSDSSQSRLQRLDHGTSSCGSGCSTVPSARPRHSTRGAAGICSLPSLEQGLILTRETLPKCWAQPSP